MEDKLFDPRMETGASNLYAPHRDMQRFPRRQPVESLTRIAAPLWQRRPSAAIRERAGSRLDSRRVTPITLFVTPMNRLIGLMAATATVVLPVAAPARAETLAEAVALAYARNPGLNRQRFRQKAVDEDYVQTRAGYGPQLTVSATSNYSRTEFVQPNLSPPRDVVVDANAGRATATLSQPLYTSGRLRGQLAAARAGVHAGQETLRRVEQEVVAQVITVYAAVLRDEARLEVGRQNVAVLRQQLDEKVERRKRSDVTLTDVGQADARLAAAESQLAQLEAQLAITRGQYVQAIGQNPGTLAPLPDIGPLPASIDEAFVQAEEHNAELATARRTEEVSSGTAAAARGARGLSLSATGQAIYSNRAFRIDGNDARKELVAGVTASIPLFAAGALSSRVRQADARNAADQTSIDLTRRQVMQDVTQAWSQLAAARTSLVAGQRQVASAQLAFAGMSRESLEGLRSTIDTLNAEQELQAAQLTFLQNRYLEYVARADLLLATGLLSAQAISPTIDTYDPEVHFRKVRNRGMTPLEPVAMALDRIGSASPRRPLSANLTGEAAPKPDAVEALPPTPGADLTRAPLTPITQSRLVPASELPGGLPSTGLDRPPPPGAAPPPGTPLPGTPK